jgi:hypothetical protein
MGGSMAPATVSCPSQRVELRVTDICSRVSQAAQCCKFKQLGHGISHQMYAQVRRLLTG